MALHLQWLARWPLALTVSFVTGYQVAKLLAHAPSEEKAKDVYVTITQTEWEKLAAELCALINKYSTNESITLAGKMPTADQLDALKVALKVGKYGLPSYDNLRFYPSFCCSMDNARSIPRWCAEYITDTDLKGPHWHRPRFRADHTIPAQFRAELKDYRDSGYAKGHLAAFGNHNDSRSHSECTMILSNTVPQNQAMNERPWAKLEATVRDWIENGDYVSCIVITGPMFVPNKTGDVAGKSSERYIMQHECIGGTQVHVPTHLFKVVLAEKSNPSKKSKEGAVGYDGYDLFTFMMRNVQPSKKLDWSKGDIWKQFLVQKDLVEKRTGLQFFETLRLATNNKISSKL